jgi:hypothetical protein
MMSDLRKAARLALEALEYENNFHRQIKENSYGSSTDAMKALRDTLLLPEQESVAWLYKGEPEFDGNRWHDNYKVTTDEIVAKFKDKNPQPLYTYPPQRKPLTEQEICENLGLGKVDVEFVRMVERAHGIGVEE